MSSNKRLSDISAKGEFHYATTVGLRFAPIDGYALRALANRDTTFGKDEVSVFEKAANCAESEELLVVQCGHDRKELEGIINLFTMYGIRRPKVEELRVSTPLRRGLGLRVTTPR